MSEFSAVFEWKKQLLKLQKDAKENLVLDVFKQLSTVKASTEMLTKTEIGIIVNKFRKVENEKIVQAAKSLVKQWKRDIDSNSTTTKTELKVENDGKVDSKVETEADSKGDSKVKSPVDSNIESPIEIDRIKIVKQNRTVKTDAIKFQSTNLAIRDKSLEMIYTALASDTNADSELVRDLSIEIEKTCYKSHHSQSSQAYTEKIRSIFLNLRNPNNPSLRILLLTSSLSISTFCEMTPEEMKSKERIEEERRLKEENLFRARGAVPQEAETDAFKCGKCQKRKCRYYQMQTRSADEPMTTFVTCVNCGNKWKFC